MAKQKARVFSAEFKQKAVKRFQDGEPAIAIAKDLGIRRKLLYDWKNRIDAGEELRLSGRPPKKVPPPSDSLAAAQAEIEVLQRLVGQLTAENHFFQSALRKFEPTTRSGSGKAGSRVTSGN